MSLLKLNNQEFDFEIEDYDTTRKVEEALKKMVEEEKILKKDGMHSEFLKNYCLLFYHFFDYVLGDDAGEKIFSGKYNSRVCDETYEEFLLYLRDQKGVIHTRQQRLIKYQPSKKTPQDHKKKKK